MKLLFALTSVLSLVTAVPLIAEAATPTLNVSLQNRSLQGPNWDNGSLAKLLNSIHNIVEKVVKEKVQWDLGTPAKFQGWSTYKSNGVNLGGWLVMEQAIDPDFFTKHGGNATDENALCKAMGKIRCALIMELRYATFFTKKDIDKYAASGINTLRVPIGYWAFMPAVKGMAYHTGSQLLHLTNIADYAISKGMHIVLDLHGMPGGQNGFDNQGVVGDLYWWNNQTNFDLSLKMVDLATTYILKQSHPDQWTLGLINEPLMQGPAFFGQTPESVAYLNKYYFAAVDQIRKRAQFPIMLSDGFSGAAAWDEWWAHSKQNIVFDSHIYFFSGKTYSYDVPYDACYLAKSYGNSTNPVFIGEWSIQAAAFNSLDVPTRALMFQTQLQAYLKFVNGGAFWNAKHFGNAVVGSDGSAQANYWSWELLVEQGVIAKPGESMTIASC